MPMELRKGKEHFYQLKKYFGFVPNVLLWWNPVFSIWSPVATLLGSCDEASLVSRSSYRTWPYSPWQKGTINMRPDEATCSCWAQWAKMFKVEFTSLSKFVNDNENDQTNRFLYCYWQGTMCHVVFAQITLFLNTGQIWSLGNWVLGEETGINFKGFCQPVICAGFAGEIHSIQGYVKLRNENYWSRKRWSQNLRI